MNFQTKSKQRRFVLIAAAAGLISMFLPWIRISIFGLTQSVNGLHGTGILVFLCFAASGIVAYLGDQSKNLEKTMWMITLIFAALATLIVVGKIINASRSIYGAYLSFGIYLAALAAIGILASAFLFRSPTDNIRDSFESLKNDLGNKMKSSSTTTGGASANYNNNNIPKSNSSADSETFRSNSANIGNQGYVKDPDDTNNPST